MSWYINCRTLPLQLACMTNDNTVVTATTIATVILNPASVWIPDLWFSFAADYSLTFTLRTLADFQENGKAESPLVLGKKILSCFQAWWNDRWHHRNDAVWEPAHALWQSCSLIITQTIDDTPDCELKDQRKPRSEFSESPARWHQDKAEALGSNE